MPRWLCPPTRTKAAATGRYRVQCGFAERGQRGPACEAADGGCERDVARERDGRGEQGTALKSEKRVRVEVDVDVRVVYELGGGGDEGVS